MLIPLERSCVEYCGFLCLAYFSSSPTECDLFTGPGDPPYHYVHKNVFPLIYPYIKEAIACPSVPEPWAQLHDGYTFYFSDNCQTVKNGLVYESVLPVMHPIGDITLTQGTLTGPCPLLRFSGSDVEINLVDINILCTNSEPAITISNGSNVDLIMDGVYTNSTVGVYAYGMVKSRLGVHVTGPSTAITSDLMGGGQLSVRCEGYQKVVLYETTTAIDTELTDTCKFSSLGSTSNSNLLHDYPQWQPPSMKDVDATAVRLFVVVLVIFVTRRYLK